MESVNISRLKTKLTFYLRKVRRGAIVRVLDRTIPIAIIQSIAEEKLNNADTGGVISDPPTATLAQLRSIWELPARSTKNDIVKTLLADRRSRF